MKKLPRPLSNSVLFAALAAISASQVSAHAATRTWTAGSGTSPYNWNLSSNWTGAAAAGDVLIFTGASGLSNTNDFTAAGQNGATGTEFSSLIFDSGAGAFVLGGNRIRVSGTIANNSTNLQTINNDIVLGGIVVVDAANGNIAMAGNLSARATTASYGLTKSGTGRLTLSGSSASVTPANILAINNGVVQLNHSYAANMQITVGVADGLAFGEGIGTFHIGRLGSGNVKLEDVSGNAIDLVMTNSTGSGTYAGTMIGSGSLVYDTAATSVYTLTGYNTYTGGTTLEKGVLLVQSTGNLGSGPLTISSGTLTLYNNQTVSALNGAGGVIIGHVNQSRTLTVNSAVYSSYSGSIQNHATNNQAFSLAKSGTGTLVLNGTNTYTGTTTVSGGKLTVNGELAAGSAVTVQSGATLAGKGNVRGSVSVQTGGRLSAGDRDGGTPIGVLSLGATALQGGSIFSIDLNSGGSGTAGVNWDQIAITGALNISGLSELSPVTIQLTTLNGSTAGAFGSWNSLADHTWSSVITTTSGFTGAFNTDLFLFDTSGFQNAIAGSFSMVRNGNNLDLVYTAVPEPGTFALVFGGLTLLGAALRRRRASR